MEEHCDAEMMTEDVNHFFESWEDLYREAAQSVDMMPDMPQDQEEDRGKWNNREISKIAIILRCFIGHYMTFGSRVNKLKG